jgi:hypothetical protein
VLQQVPGLGRRQDRRADEGGQAVGAGLEQLAGGVLGDAEARRSGDFLRALPFETLTVDA